MPKIDSTKGILILLGVLVVGVVIGYNMKPKSVVVAPVSLPA